MNATSLSTALPSETLAEQTAAVAVFKVKDAAQWELVLLIVVTTGYTCICTIVSTASYSVSRTTFAFVLFFSEGVANTCCLTIQLLGYIGQLAAGEHFRPSLNEGRLGKIVNYLCYLHYGFIYASQLHYLLIAVNRGIAICLPFHYYQRWWTRRNTIISTLILWTLSFAIDGSVYIFIRNSLKYYFIAAGLQILVTIPSLAIYFITLGWVLLNRFVMPSLTRGRNEVETGVQNRGGAIVRFLHSITPGSSMKSVDLRTFAYCFLAFIPNCYFMVARPAPGSLHLQLYANTRLASAGILLYVMSSLVRERLMPWRIFVPARLVNLSKATNAVGVTPTLLTPLPNSKVVSSSTSRAAITGVYRLSWYNRNTIAVVAPAKSPSPPFSIQREGRSEQPVSATSAAAAAGQLLPPCHMRLASIPSGKLTAARLSSNSGPPLPPLPNGSFPKVAWSCANEEEKRDEHLVEKRGD